MAVITKTKRTSERKAKQRKQATVKEKEAVVSGLCLTCNHKKTCAFRYNQTQPVVFCEEFESFVPTVEEEVVSEPVPTPEDMREWDEYKGLCANCENRKECAIRNSEIGVWHCEEYQ